MQKESLIQTLYITGKNKIGTKHSSKVAHMSDLNKLMLTLDLDKTPFYHKYEYLRLENGIFKKRESKSCITYIKDRDLTEKDLEVIEQEHQDAINKAQNKAQNKAWTEISQEKDEERQKKIDEKIANRCPECKGELIILPDPDPECVGGYRKYLDCEKCGWSEYLSDED